MKKKDENESLEQDGGRQCLPFVAVVIEVLFLKDYYVCEFLNKQLCVCVCVCVCIAACGAYP